MKQKEVAHPIFCLAHATYKVLPETSRFENLAVVKDTIDEQLTTKLVWNLIKSKAYLAD